jgi:uracil-DNA glycosylase
MPPASFHDPDEFALHFTSGLGFHRIHKHVHFGTHPEILQVNPWLAQEFEHFSDARVIVALGKIAFDTCLSILKQQGTITKTSDYRFGHRVLHNLNPALLCSYHPSQQNTSTGRLTQQMLDDIFLDAARIISQS